VALLLQDVTSKTNRWIVPKLLDNVFKSSPLFTRMKTRNAVKFEGGTAIRQPIMYAELKGGAFSRGGTFDISYVQTDTAMEFQIKYYYVNITLYGTDNVLNRGPEAAMSYVESKMVNAAAKMAKLLATDMFLDGQGVASSPIQLDGLAAAVDDGTNFPTYGAITRADIATGPSQGINSYVRTPAGGILSLADVQTAYGQAWFGNEHVDLIVGTQNIWNIFWNKMQPQQRFLEESSDVAKVGFEAFRFNNATVVVDQYAPEGILWLLNTKYIDFYVSAHQKYQFGFTGWKEAQNTDDVTGQYLYAGNLVVTAPRLQAKIVGITG
jgi:hypothetical protein